jgi:hypothetical protein
MEPNANDNTPNQNQRLVLFVGPHKSASTSIQNFFVEHASNDYKHHHRDAAFENWTWPFWPYAMHPNAFAELVINFRKRDAAWHDERRAELYYTVGVVWETSGNNVIIGEEEFDRMGYTPFSNRNGLRVLQNLIDFLEPPRLDIVVNYRTPRSAHWISIWKQLTQGSSYEGLVCGARKPWEHLNSVGNPLGIVQTLLSKGLLNVTLIDMGGVERAKLDISHVIACDVLNVPCEDGWVEGLNRTGLRANERNHDPGLTSKQIEEIEWVLRQRDCAYMRSLESYIGNGLTILHRDTLWRDCDEAPIEIQQQLQNTTFLHFLLQSQIDCGPEDLGTNITNYIFSFTKTSFHSSVFKTARIKRATPQGKLMMTTPAERSRPLPLDSPENSDLVNHLGDIIAAQTGLLIMVGCAWIYRIRSYLRL